MPESESLNSGTIFEEKISIMPTPRVYTREVYCFPRRKLIFRFGRRVIYLSKGLSEYIPKSFASVCTTIIKRIAVFFFYPKSLMIYINVYR